MDKEIPKILISKPIPKGKYAGEIIDIELERIEGEIKKSIVVLLIDSKFNLYEYVIIDIKGMKLECIPIISSTKILNEIPSNRWFVIIKNTRIIT